MSDLTAGGFGRPPPNGTKRPPSKGPRAASATRELSATADAAALPGAGARQGRMAASLGSDCIFRTAAYE